MKFKSLFCFILIIIISSVSSFSMATNVISNSNSNNVTNEIISESTIIPPEVFADSAILLDVGSGKMLYEKNSKAKMYPASTTKLLAAIIVVEKCPDLTQLVNISYHAVHSVPYSYSIANLQPGEQISLKDLLNALLIQSANEAAYSLAEYVSNNGNNFPTDSSSSSKATFDKSIETFANMMNSKAKELGCENSHFVNPNGVHNENHYTTAYDLMLIGQYAYANPILTSICKSVQFSLPSTNIYTGEPRTFKTTNSLMRRDKPGYYEYANGLKTGFTDPAQSCIISSAKKDDRDLIAVVLHSDEKNEQNESRDSDCKRLFEFGFNTYCNKVIVNENDKINELKIWNGTKDTKMLNGLCSKEIKTLVVANQALNVVPEITVTKDVAPILKGEVIGSVSYTLNGETFTSDILAEHDVIPINFGLYLLIGVSVLFLLVLLIIINHSRKRKKRRHSKKKKKKN